MTFQNKGEQAKLHELLQAIETKLAQNQLSEPDRAFVTDLLAEVRADLDSSMLATRRIRMPNGISAAVLHGHPSLGPSSGAMGSFLARLEFIYDDLPDGYRWDWKSEREGDPVPVIFRDQGVVCDLVQTWGMAGIHVTLLDGSRRHGFGGDSGLYFGLLAGLSEGPWWILEEKKTISEIPALSSKISVNAGDESTLVAIPVAFDDEDLAALYDPSRGQWINDRIDLAAIHLRSNAQNADIARLLQWINVTTKSFPVIQSAISVGEMIGLLLGALDNQRRSHLLGEVALAVTSTWLAGSRAWVYSAEEYKLP